MNRTNETKMTKMTFKRVRAGMYQSGDWTVARTDETERGYRWVALHHDKGEHYAPTRAAAVAAARRANQPKLLDSSAEPK